MTEPQTPTGRAMFVLSDEDLFTPGRVKRDAVALVEIEAIAMDRKRLLAEVESQRPFSDPDIWDQFVAILLQTPSS